MAQATSEQARLDARKQDSIIENTEHMLASRNDMRDARCAGVPLVFE